MWSSSNSGMNAQQKQKEVKQVKLGVNAGNHDVWERYRSLEEKRRY